MVAPAPTSIIWTDTPDQIYAAHAAHADRVRHQARRWGRPFPWLLDDFESDALLALWNAARTFLASLGLSFEVYAGKRVRQALKDRLKRELAGNPAAFVPRTRRQADRTLAALTARPTESERGADTLAELLALIPPADAAILARRFRDGDTFERIGDALGTTEDGARWRVAVAMRELRERLGDGYALGA